VVNHCDCGDEGQQDIYICSGSEGVCLVQRGVCADDPEPDCGWSNCDPVFGAVDAICDSLAGQMSGSYDEPSPCTRDEDCRAGHTCSVRVDNILICSDAQLGAGGASNGAGGAKN
jgi:hypothetical protein